MTHGRVIRFLRISAWSALISLSLMTWAFVDPRPLPMVISMTVGQVLGTLSLSLFVVVVGADLWHRRVLQSRIDESGERL